MWVGACVSFFPSPYLVYRFSITHSFFFKNKTLSLFSKCAQLQETVSLGFCPPGSSKSLFPLLLFVPFFLLVSLIATSSVPSLLFLLLTPPQPTLFPSRLHGTYVPPHSGIPCWDGDRTPAECCHLRELVPFLKSEAQNISQPKQVNEMSLAWESRWGREAVYLNIDSADRCRQCFSVCVY